MDGSSFHKTRRLKFWDIEKPKWDAAQKAREKRDEAVWQEHLDWMARMEKRLEEMK